MTGNDQIGEQYRQERLAHWESLVEQFSHNGVRHEYHRRLSELFCQIIPEGSKVLEIGCAKGDLLAELKPAHGVGIDFNETMLSCARSNYPQFEFRVGDAQDLSFLTDTFDFVIVSDLLGDLWDVQHFFQQLPRFCHCRTRIVINFNSQLWSLPLKIAQHAGLATPMLPQNWLTIEDASGLLELAGFRVISHRAEIILPLPIPLVTSLFNRYLVKIWPFRHLNLVHLLVAAPGLSRQAEMEVPTVSVIVPVRNEAGNIAELLARIPEMGRRTEIVFVEGGSTDNTCEVITAQIAAKPPFNCRLLRQTGTGKGDAVRLGFSEARGEILMILDADMTVAPEDLPKFYEALVQGNGDFINGVRLVYPLSGKAMRFMNLVGNKFFSLAFSWLFGQKIKDTLCGTKALWKSDYRQIAERRHYFGDCDPFGDFDLLLGAVRHNLRIVEIPVRYGERRYGKTNINRWSDGWLLLRMVMTAARKIKFI